MSLKRNIFASYVSQIYVALIGILILPVYLKYMGAEAYGLVGFFTMLQAWFNLLDIGLTPTVARETARLRGGAISALSYRRLLRALQFVFLGVALLGGGAMLACSGLIAYHWLDVQNLPLSDVMLALQLMSAGVALRWMAGLYRACISGAEKLVWLSAFNSVVATLRFVVVLIVLVWIDRSPAAFFTYQLLVALFELVCLAIYAHGQFPAIPEGSTVGWAPISLFLPIKNVLGFSLAIAFTSSVWILVTQTDKLILSKLLPLAQYGYFTLAVLAASGVMMISGPISGPLLPRMTRLQAEGNEVGLTVLYRNATQVVAAIAIPVCLVLSFFSEQVLWIWTGDSHAAVQASPVLRLYALGNGFLAMSAFPYYLQFAKGQLKLHLIGNLLFLFFLIPALIWATWKHGAIGAGYAWLSANMIYFFLWTPVVHGRFLPSLHFKWLCVDIGVIAALGTGIACVILFFVQWPHERLQALFLLSLFGVVLFFSSVISSSFMRTTISERFFVRTGV